MIAFSFDQFFIDCYVTSVVTRETNVTSHLQGDEEYRC